MVTVVHVYNRWKNSEISCYVNGELASFGDIPWFVNTSDVSGNNLRTVCSVGMKTFKTHLKRKEVIKCVTLSFWQKYQYTIV